MDVGPRITSNNVSSTCLLRHYVQIGSWFIQHQNRRILQQGACNRQSLAFTTGQPRPCSPINVSYPFGNPAINSWICAERLPPTPSHPTQLWTRQTQILADGCVKEITVLRDEHGSLSRLPPIQLEHLATKTDLSQLILPEAEQQIDDRALPRAARTNDGYGVPGCTLKVTCWSAGVGWLGK